MTTDFDGSAITVSVTTVGGNYGLYGDNNNNHAFAININGTGVKIENITPGFALLDVGGKESGVTGNSLFEFLMDGPQNEPGAILPLNFRVTKLGGFLDEFDLFEKNLDGWYAAAHLVNKATGEQGHVAAMDPQSPGAPVPEPTTMVLLGSGLLVVFRARKAARKA